MIGENPKPRRIHHPNAYKPDLRAPSTIPGLYGHHTRYANSNYRVQKLNWRQSGLTHEPEDVTDQKVNLQVNFVVKTDKKQLEQKVKKLVSERMNDYDRRVEERRTKLKELFAKEEREHVKECVNAALTGAENALTEASEKMAQNRAKADAERIALVEGKRIRQYKARCEEAYTMDTRRNLIEAKVANLQQMREKEARRAKAKEEEAKWCDLMRNETLAQQEREEQNVLEAKRQQRETMQVLRKQILADRTSKEEAKRTDVENRLEMERAFEIAKRKDLEEEEGERRKREKFAEDVQQQLAVQRQVQAERERKEKVLDDLFARLNEAEVRKEKEKIQNLAQQMHKEQVMYLRYLEDIRRARLEEQRRIEKFANEEAKKCQEKLEMQRCAVKQHWSQVQQEVMEGRAEQIALRTKKREETERIRKDEEKMLNAVLQHNEILTEERNRTKKQEQKTYYEDLLKQAAYLKTIKRKQDLEIEEQIAKAQEEEIRYLKLVHDLYNKNVRADEVLHPFRRIFNKRMCTCPVQD